MNVPYSILLIAITAGITFMLRAFPFLIFRGKKQLPALSMTLPASCRLLLLLFLLFIV